MMIVIKNVKFKTVIFFLMLFLISISGCVLSTPGALELSVKSTAAKHNEVIREAEGKMARKDTYSVADLQALCTAYYETKAFKKLFDCLDALERNVDRQELRQTVVWHYTPVLISMNRSEAYMDLGDYKKALAEASKALNQSRNLEPVTIAAYKPFGFSKSEMSKILKHREVHVLTRLGLTQMLAGQRDEALKTLDQIKKTEVPEALTKMKQIGLAKIYMANKEYHEALSAINDAGDYRPFARFEGQEGTYEDLPIAFIRTKCLFEIGQTEEARKGYDELLHNPRLEDLGGVYWMALLDRARIADLQGKTAEAIEFLERAVAVIERQRSTINTETGKIGFVGDKQDVYHELIRMLYRNRQQEKAFEYVERSKARALVDLLATKKDFAVKSGNEQEIRAVLAMNETADTETIIRDVSIDKSKTRSVQIKLRQDIQTKSPELASLVTVTSPSVSALQSHIPADEVLIEYYYRDKDMYAFVVSKSGLRAIKLNVTGLTEDIQAFRNDIQSYNSNQYAEISRKLHKRLIQPLEEHLDKRNLIIVPHGVLHYLPFNALHDGTNYVIDKYSIRLLPSAGVIQYLKAGKANKAGDILVFGNPDLGDPADDLDNAQNEALAVAKMRPRSKVFLRKEATISAFQKYGSAFNIIHFATHGQFNPDDPLKSALLLARDSESDGRLTIDRLYSTKLDANLVTLSACETGLSKIANGDDLVGLTRGFLYAGSSSIVASLWEVNDFTTSQLMTRFYKEMESTDKREALRTAQLETKKKYPHPYFWASFQLTGNAK